MIWGFLCLLKSPFFFEAIYMKKSEIRTVKKSMIFLGPQNKKFFENFESFAGPSKESMTLQDVKI
jgi:hypothetical protein